MAFEFITSTVAEIETSLQKVKANLADANNFKILEGLFNKCKLSLTVFQAEKKNFKNQEGIASLAKLFECLRDINTAVMTCAKAQKKYDDGLTHLQSFLQWIDLGGTLQENCQGEFKKLQQNGQGNRDWILLARDPNYKPAQQPAQESKKRAQPLASEDDSSSDHPDDADHDGDSDHEGDDDESVKRKKTAKSSKRKTKTASVPAAAATKDTSAPDLSDDVGRAIVAAMKIFARDVTYSASSTSSMQKTKKKKDARGVTYEYLERVFKVLPQGGDDEAKLAFGEKVYARLLALLQLKSQKKNTLNFPNLVLKTTPKNARDATNRSWAEKNSFQSTNVDAKKLPEDDDMGTVAVVSSTALDFRDFLKKQFSQFFNDSESVSSRAPDNASAASAEASAGAVVGDSVMSDLPAGDQAPVVASSSDLPEAVEPARGNVGAAAPVAVPAAAGEAADLADTIGAEVEEQRLREELYSLQQQRALAEQQKEELELEILRNLPAKDCVEYLGPRVETRKEELLRVQADIRKRSEDLETLIATEKSLQKESDDLQALLKNIQAKDNSNRNLVEELKETRREQQGIEDRSQALAETVRELKRTIERKSNQHAKLSAELTANIKAEESLRAEIRYLDSAIKEKQTQLGEGQARQPAQREHKRKLEVEIGDLRNQLSGLQQVDKEAATLEGQRARLQQEVTARTSEAEAKRKANEKKRGELAALQKEFDTNVNQMLEQQRLAEGIQQSIDAQKVLNAKQKEKLAGLEGDQKQLADLQAQYKTLMDTHGSEQQLAEKQAKLAAECAKWQKLLAGVNEALASQERMIAQRKQLEADTVAGRTQMQARRDSVIGLMAGNSVLVPRGAGAASSPAPAAVGAQQSPAPAPAAANTPIARK